MQKVNERHLVGVYGTLRKEHHNHYLLASAEFRGEAMLHSPLAMYRCGYLPYVLFKENEVHALKLEFYEVSSSTLSRLDSLEGHPEWYKRVRVPTKKGEAWVYLMPESHAEGKRLEYVEGGDWAKVKF